MHRALNSTLAGLPDDTKVFVRNHDMRDLGWRLGAYEMLTRLPQPGHEYTKGNVKFGTKVMQTDGIKRLEQYAEENKETQGKFTIGDEKVR
jgi:hydroxyacylglutathione hydrolase